MKKYLSILLIIAFTFMLTACGSGSNPNDQLYKEDDFEIVGITGTVSKNGCHIHISLADKDGNTVGGHLTDGCLINTTCEVCIESFDNYYFDRVFDDETGYKELVIKNKNDIKKI